MSNTWAGDQQHQHCIRGTTTGTLLLYSQGLWGSAMTSSCRVPCFLSLGGGWELSTWASGGGGRSFFFRALLRAFLAAFVSWRGTCFFPVGLIAAWWPSAVGLPLGSTWGPPFLDSSALAGLSPLPSAFPGLLPFPGLPFPGLTLGLPGLSLASPWGL